MTQAASKSKFWLRLLGGAIFLLIVMCAAAFLLLDAERFRPVVISELERALARKVSIGKLSASLFPPSFSASSLEIGDDPAFSSKPFLRAAGLSVRPSLIPLLSGKMDIQSIEIQAPRVELMSDAAGQWNYASLGGPKGASGSKPVLALARLLIEDATLGVKTASGPREVYQHLGVELRDYIGEGKPFYMRLGATMQNQSRIAAEGTVLQQGTRTELRDTSFALAGLKGKVDGSIDAEQLNLKISLPQSPLAQLAPLFLPKGMVAQGEIAANIDAKGTLKSPQLKGQIDVRAFSVSGGDIKQPVQTAALLLRLDPERITLQPTQVLSGSTQLQVFGVISQYSSTPRIEATLISEKAKLSELLAMARAYGVKAVEGVNANGEASLQLRAHGTMKALQLTGGGALREAVLELPSLTKPLQVASADFRFEQDSLSISKLDAKIGSSHPTGELKIRNFRDPQIDFNLAVDQLNVAEMRTLVKPVPADESGPAPALSASGDLSIGTLQLEGLTLTQMRGKTVYAGKRLVVEPLTAQIYGGTHAGRLSVDLQPKVPVYTLDSRLVSIESSKLLAAVTAIKGVLSGPLSGAMKLSLSPGTPEEMARSLNGTISLKVDKGRLASFNLTNELAGVAKFMGFPASADSFTQFQTLGGDLRIDNGVASTENFRIELGNIAASLSGTMNLADQTLNLKLVNTLDKRFSEQVGGSQVGGFMSAALSNARGELLIPVSITGTFANPRMAPDPAAIARLKVQQFNPSNPKQMMDNVNSVIDMFRKKKPAEQKP